MKRLLPLLLLLASAPAPADSGAYRVEVIIFRNLQAVAEPVEVQELRSFSQFPSLFEDALPLETIQGSAMDPLANAGVDPPQDQAGSADVNESTGLPGDNTVDPPQERTGHLPDDLFIINDKSTHMDGVWRRLRGSPGYRPLMYTAWEQNRTDYYPPMRLHDEQLIDVQLRPPTAIMIADLAAADPLAAYRSAFYRIDGTVQLRRSRFLHLFLDLEYRDMSPRPDPQPSFFGVTDTGIDAATQNSGQNNGPYHVFSLKQNRQIRTGIVQYFDTPWFGALVFVTAISPNRDNRPNQQQ